MIEKKDVVKAVTYDKNIAKISIVEVPDRPGIAAYLFTQLAKENINIDMIIQSVAKEGKNDISFTVSKEDATKAVSITKKVAEEIKAKEVIFDTNSCKVSIVGAGMASRPGVAATMFTALGKNKINIEMISTADIKISCIIAAKYATKAVKILHDAFKLGKK